MSLSDLVSSFSSSGMDNEPFFGWLSSQGQQIFDTYSGRDILSAARQAGYSIGNKDFFALRREVLGLERFEQQIGGLRPDTTVPASLINTDHAFRLSGNFLYRFNISYIDPDTGEKVNSYGSVLSNEQLSTDEARRRLEEQIAITPRREGDPYDLEYEIGDLQNVLGQQGLFRGRV